MATIVPLVGITPTGEKEKFSMGRNAIEGLARSELGLIKPGEIFYQFKEKESIEVIHNKTDESVD